MLASVCKRHVSAHIQECRMLSRDGYIVPCTCTGVHAFVCLLKFCMYAWMSLRFCSVHAYHVFPENVHACLRASSEWSDINVHKYRPKIVFLVCFHSNAYVY